MRSNSKHSKIDLSNKNQFQSDGKFSRRLSKELMQEPFVNMPRKNNVEWRANNDNAGKIVTRLSRVQSHKVDLPIKPEDLHRLDNRS